MLVFRVALLHEFFILLLFFHTTYITGRHIYRCFKFSRFMTLCATLGRHEAHQGRHRTGFRIVRQGKTFVALPKFNNDRNTNLNAKIDTSYLNLAPCYVTAPNLNSTRRVSDCCHPQDNNGTIENEELRGFLKDLLELVKKVSIET